MSDQPMDLAAIVAVEAARARRVSASAGTHTGGHVLDVRIRVNSAVDRWHLETFPQILAVVDRDGDVWTRYGDLWVWLPADGKDEVLINAERLAAQYSPLRVAWVQR